MHIIGSFLRNLPRNMVIIIIFFLLFAQLYAFFLVGLITAENYTKTSTDSVKDNIILLYGTNGNDDSVDKNNMLEMLFKKNSIPYFSTTEIIYRKSVPVEVPIQLVDEGILDWEPVLQKGRFFIDADYKEDVNSIPILIPEFMSNDYPLHTQIEQNGLKLEVIGILNTQASQPFLFQESLYNQSITMQNDYFIIPKLKQTETLIEEHDITYYTTKNEEMIKEKVNEILLEVKKTGIYYNVFNRKEEVQAQIDGLKNESESALYQVAFYLVFVLLVIVALTVTRYKKDGYYNGVHLLLGASEQKIWGRLCLEYSALLIIASGVFLLVQVIFPTKSFYEEIMPLYFRNNQGRAVGFSFLFIEAFCIISLLIINWIVLRATTIGKLIKGRGAE